MISGLAPGNDADTEMVGKSTCGKRRDRQQREGRERRTGTTAAVRSVVAIGRLMKGAEKFMTGSLWLRRRQRGRAGLRPRIAATLSAKPSKNR